MSQYLILIYGEEAETDAISEQQMQEIMRGHDEFGKKHADAIRGGNALLSPSTATTVRNGGSGALVTDGPFVEAKEGLGGYYVVEAADRDAAVAIAHDIPTVNGGVEVREIQVFN